MKDTRKMICTCCDQDPGEGLGTSKEKSNICGSFLSETYLKILLYTEEALRLSK